MKKILIYTMIVAALILSACGGANMTEPAATEAPQASEEQTAAGTAERCGDTSQLADEIFLYTWVDYMDPEIIPQFETECGVKVNETNYDSNETLLATLQAGSADYDIIVPSDYMVTTLIDEGLVMEIDYNVVSNIKNMEAANLNTYFDPEQRYTVPYFWGTSGFAVDTNVVTDVQDSWSMLFDPNSPYCGQISMLDDERETLGAALMYLGYSINDTDPAHLEEAKNLLIEQSQCVKAYDSQTNDDLIISGETVLTHAWTGDAITAGTTDLGGREGIDYIIPQEGCTIWQDNMMLPEAAPNAYTAMVFMNYLHFPDVAAQNAEYVGYGTPNKAAKEVMDPDILADERIYPSAEVSEHLQWIEDVGPALELYDRVWTEFKAAIGQQ
jgi:spermidine/putrescine transport system substrate-binding protein